MSKETTDILEALNFIKDRMATKDDVAELKTELKADIAGLDDRLVAIESKIGGIHNRIDEGALRHSNLENRVRHVLPNLPEAPLRL